MDPFSSYSTEHALINWLAISGSPDSISVALDFLSSQMGDFELKSHLNEAACEGGVSLCHLTASQPNHVAECLTIWRKNGLPLFLQTAAGNSPLYVATLKCNERGIEFFHSNYVSPEERADVKKCFYYAIRKKITVSFDTLANCEKSLCEHVYTEPDESNQGAHSVAQLSAKYGASQILKWTALNSRNTLLSAPVTSTLPSPLEIVCSSNKASAGERHEMCITMAKYLVQNYFTLYTKDRKKAADKVAKICDHWFRASKKDIPTDIHNIITLYAFNDPFPTKKVSPQYTVADNNCSGENSGGGTQQYSHLLKNIIEEVRGDECITSHEIEQLEELASVYKAPL